MNEQYIMNELAIRNLYAAYTFAADDHDVDAFVDCFTPDAKVEVSSFKVMKTLIAAGRAPFVNAEGWVVGADNIRAMASWVSNDALFLHLSANVLVARLVNDKAEGQAAFVVFGNDGLVEHYGRYQDKLALCPDGRWRFTERRDICRYELAREGVVFGDAKI